MSTIVKDPFFVDMHTHFGFETFDLFKRAKHPTAWIEYERNLITEDELFSKFFIDKRIVDGEAFKRYLYDSYCFLDGLEDLMTELNAGGAELHLFSNYPPWWTLIEEKLKLSRFAPWTFVSAETGLRKPDRESFIHAAELVGRQPSECILLDDRQSNCDSAILAGYRNSHRFMDVDSAREQLRIHFKWLSKPS